MTLSINEKNDLFLDDNGNVSVSYDLKAVLQNCQTAVQMVKGEAIYRSSDGIPAFETLWTGNPNLQQAEASIRATILRVSGVTNIKSFEYNLNNNIFSYNVEIETIYGADSMEGSLSV